MRKAIAFVSLLLLITVTTDLVGQNRRLVVVNPSEKELLKEANRLRISPERLKDVRVALNEVIQLLPETAEGGPFMLGRQLVRFESRQAPELISALYEKLLAQAEQETLPGRLNALRVSAFDLTSALRKKDPELADRLERRWPEAGAQGAAADPRGIDPVAQRAMFENMRKNPEEVMSQLPQAETAGTNFGLRGALLRQLWSQGKQDAARQLLEETLAISPSSSLQRDMGYGQFIRMAMSTFPDARDQLFSAVSAWYSDLAQTGGADSEFRLPSGDVLNVSRADFALLSQLTGFHQFHPEFAERLAGISPTLQAKMKAAGGLSGMFRWETPARNELRRSIAESTGPQLDAAVAGISNPQDLSMALSDICNGEDPEKAEKVFDLILQRIQTETNPTTAAQQMMNLGQECIPCVGALPDGWFRFGKELVRNLSEMEQQGQPAEQPMGTGHPRFYNGLSSHLEGFLLAKKARTDFSEVMDEVRAMTDKNRRVRALMQIVQDLGQQ